MTSTDTSLTTPATAEAASRYQRLRGHLAALRLVCYQLPGPATLPAGGTSLLSCDFTIWPLERSTRPSCSMFGTSGSAATGTQVSKVSDAGVWAA
ncbi:MAG TPA: hypothetical protein VEF72_01070 [Mycobacterium sp.]|nr:hypothetical protein [Mycobacterium sp.]